MIQIHYESPGPVLSDFLADTDSRFLGVRGPFGSGKSVASCIKLAMLACSQPPSPRDGIRKSRIGIVRNTNPQLRTTTINTWLDWFPENQFGRFRWSPPFTHHWRPETTGDVDAEFIFLPLDREDSIAQLLSLELTHVWFNEARELDKGVIDAAMSRIGRYPSRRDGGVPNAMAIADTNSPSEEHWWPIMAGDVPIPEWMSEADRVTLVKPDGWRFLDQPPAMLERRDGDGRLVGYELNPAAENLENIGGDYYRNMVAGKGADWISVYLRNQYGSLQSGRPVYEDKYDAQVHEMEDLWPNKGARVIAGVDFGLTPAVIWLMDAGGGAWIAFEEKVWQRGSAVDVGEHIRGMRQRLPDAEILIRGDPAGRAGSDADLKSAYDILEGMGIFAEPVLSNSNTVREDCVVHLLMSLGPGRKPRLRICRRCVVLRSAMRGGYRRDTVRHRGDDSAVMKPAPVKNRFSHPAEALQYAVMGTGAYEEVIGLSPQSLKPRNARAVERRQRRHHRRQSSMRRVG